MDRVVTSCYPVVFLLALSQYVAWGYVEPPTNVTLQCRNLQNILRWSYDDPPPGLKYEVLIRSTLSPKTSILVYPPDLHADLSSLSEPSNDYHLTVTAVVGSNKSAPTKGIIFSYFENSPAQQTCLMDLPMVNVTAQKDDLVQFRFVHPWVFHQKKQDNRAKPGAKKRRSHDPQTIDQLPQFKYDVSLNKEKHSYSFTCEERVCQKTLSVDAAQEKHCLNITGEMEKMSVQPIQVYCTTLTPAENNNHIYIYIVIGVLIVITLAFILFMVFKKKTKPSSSLPSFMTNPGGTRQLTLNFGQEQVNVPEVDPQSPTFLLSATDITDETLDSTEVECRLPIGVPAEDESVCKDVEAWNAGESDYMQGGKLDDDETPDDGEIRSSYERRPVFDDNLAQGEVVEGYRAGTGIP